MRKSGFTSSVGARWVRFFPDVRWYENATPRLQDQQSSDFEIDGKIKFSSLPRIPERPKRLNTPVFKRRETLRKAEIAKIRIYTKCNEVYWLFYWRMYCFRCVKNSAKSGYFRTSVYAYTKNWHDGDKFFCGFRNCGRLRFSNVENSEKSGFPRTSVVTKTQLPGGKIEAKSKLFGLLRNW